MDWNWAAIEAISSVVGAVCVVVSVIFLVDAVHHKTKATEGTTVQALVDLARGAFAPMAENAELYPRGGVDIPACQRRNSFCMTGLSVP